MVFTMPASRRRGYPNQERIMSESQTGTAGDPTQEDANRAAAVIEEARQLGIMGCMHEGPCPSGGETEAELEHFPPLALDCGRAIFSQHVRQVWSEVAPGDNFRAELMSAVLMAISNLAAGEYDAARNDHLRHIYGFVVDRARDLALDLREATLPVDRILEQRLCGGWTLEQLTGMRDRNVEKGWPDHSREYRVTAAERWDEYAERARENARKLREEPESEGAEGAAV